jgi:hypothetical protein
MSLINRDEIQVGNKTWFDRIDSITFETGIDPYGPDTFPIMAVVVNGKRFIATNEAKETTYRCPVCGSDAVYGEHFEYGLDDCHQPCGCYDCGATWDEVYEFAYKTNIKKGGR